MQILFLTDAQTVLLCFILWPVFQVSAAVICQKLPDRYFSPDAPLFKTRKWEADGELYRKLFFVTKWKKFLPDGAALFKGGYKKKNLLSFSKGNLSKFLIESCRGELAHLVAILPFWVFGLFTPPGVVFIMLVYALVVNMPCIIVQRYNRPRFQKLVDRMERK